MALSVFFARVGAIRCFLLMLLLAAVSPAAEPDKAISPAPAAESTDDADEPEPPPADPLIGEYWHALTLLRSGKPAEIAAGREALQSLAEREHVHSQFVLGNCLFSGSYGFPRDQRKGAAYFRLAAERGNAFAKVSLGQCYLMGTGVARDEDRAYQWLTAALAPDADYSTPERPAEPPPEASYPSSEVAGDLSNDPVAESRASAHYFLGQICTHRKQLAEAQAHYVAAARAGTDGRSGFQPAALQAAQNYAFGVGVPRDMAKATEMLEQSRKLAARQTINLIHNYAALKLVDEFAVADLEESATREGAGFESGFQLRIAEAMADRKSKDYNPAEAAKWYELAAENGQVWAMLPLAFLYLHGDLGKPEPEKAFAWFERAGSGDVPKHYLAAANLAICYANGIGTPRDPEKAAALFRRHRDIEIVCYLGATGKCPAIPVTAAEELALNETWAKKGDPHAQYLLGIRYLNGWGVGINRAAAIRWLKQAAKAKHGGALCQLGLIYEFSPAELGERDSRRALQKATECYSQAADAGDLHGMANFASMLFDGRGIIRDPQRSERLYLRCLEKDPNFARADSNLGVLYEQRLRTVVDTIDQLSIELNRKLMLEHYESAIRQKFPYAAFNLGVLCVEGRLIPQDLRRAYTLFEQAAEWGLPVAHFNLGIMHEEGAGVPVTYTEAAYHYRLAALEGHREALRRLINFYLIGKGVSPDLERAIFWMLRLEQTGDTSMTAIICDLMLQKGDYATVLPILRRFGKSRSSAFSGFAYDRLATCYEKGLGVEPDAARAAKYRKLAVKEGNADALARAALQDIAAGKEAQGVATLHRVARNSVEACYALAQMYHSGSHVQKNLRQALAYARLAANTHHPGALCFLASLTCENVDGAPSLSEAIDLAQQAENIGNPDAKVVREKLEALKNERQQGQNPAMATATPK